MNTDNQKKSPIWTRLIDIIFRAAHVCMIGVLLGAAIFDIPDNQLVIWKMMIAATGILLIASEIYHKSHWIFQGRALMVILHAGLFVVVRFYPITAIPLLVAGLTIGMLGSHMPKRFRYYSFLHKRVMD